MHQISTRSTFYKKRCEKGRGFIGGTKKVPIIGSHFSLEFTIGVHMPYRSFFCPTNLFYKSTAHISMFKDSKTSRHRSDS